MATKKKTTKKTIKKTSRTTKRTTPGPRTARLATGRGTTGTAALTSEQLRQRLGEVARIGSLFIEGEDVLNALMPDSRTWTLGDDINFDPAVAVPLKKTLLRIELIETQFPVYAIVWRRRPDDPGKVEVIMAGRMNSSFDIGKGKCPPMFPAIRQVFEKGKPAFVDQANSTFEQASLFRYGHVWIAHNDSLLRGNRGSGGPNRVVSCFHPVRDSRDEVVAALELTCVGTDN